MGSLSRSLIKPLTLCLARHQWLSEKGELEGCHAAGDKGETLLPPESVLAAERKAFPMKLTDKDCKKFIGMPREAMDQSPDEFFRYEESNGPAGTYRHRARIIDAGQVISVEVVPSFRKANRKAKRAKRTNPTPDDQRERNTLRSKLRLILILANNFIIGRDRHIVPTYRKDAEPATIKDHQKKLSDFQIDIKALCRSKGYDDPKWVRAIGGHGHHMHAHYVLSCALSFDEIQACWPYGKIYSTSLERFGNGIIGMAEYLYKQNEEEKAEGKKNGFHMWSTSRNLIKPQMREVDSALDNRKINRLGNELEDLLPEKLEDVFKGFKVERIKANPHKFIESGVSTRCVMQKAYECKSPFPQQDSISEPIEKSIGPDFSFMYDHDRYFMPGQYYGRYMNVSASKTSVYVYDGDILVKTFDRGNGKGERIYDVNDLPSDPREYGSYWNTKYFLDQARKIGPYTEKFIQQYIAKWPYPVLIYRSCQILLYKWKRKKGEDEHDEERKKAILESCCRETVLSRQFSYGYVMSEMKLRTGK